MEIRIAIGFSLTLWASRVGAQNFFKSIPKEFDFIQTERISWTDLEGTWITGLWVQGETNTTESYSIPLGYEFCANSMTGANSQQICSAWFNNGSATFGGPYADGLVSGHSYHFSLGWQNSSFQSSSTSERFFMTGLDAQDNSTLSSNSTSSTSPSSSITSPNTSNTPNTPTTPNTASATQAPVTSTPTLISSSRHKSLATGAVAGIAVGAILGVGLIFAGLFFLLRRRRSNRGQLAAFAGDKGIPKASPSYADDYADNVPSMVRSPDLGPTQSGSFYPEPTSGYNVIIPDQHLEEATSGDHLLPGEHGLSRSGSAVSMVSSLSGDESVAADNEITAEHLRELEEERIIDAAIRESDRLAELKAKERGEIVPSNEGMSGT